jgi:hypothetical protein
MELFILAQGSTVLSFFKSSVWESKTPLQSNLTCVWLMEKYTLEQLTIRLNFLILTISTSSRSLHSILIAWNLCKTYLILEMSKLYKFSIVPQKNLSETHLALWSTILTRKSVSSQIHNPKRKSNWLRMTLCLFPTRNHPSISALKCNHNLKISHRSNRQRSKNHKRVNLKQQTRSKLIRHKKLSPKTAIKDSRKNWGLPANQKTKNTTITKIVLIISRLLLSKTQFQWQIQLQSILKI